MWTAETRALVGDFGAGQALSGEQYALLVPLIPPAKPRRPAAYHGHAPPPRRAVLPRAHGLPVAPPAAAPGLPAVADDLRLHAGLRGRGRVGDHPPPPRGDAARAGG